MSVAPGLRVLLLSNPAESSISSRLAGHLGALDLEVVVRAPGEALPDGSLGSDGALAALLGKDSEVQQLMPLIRAVASERRFGILLEGVRRERLGELGELLDDRNVFDLGRGVDDESLRKVALSVRQRLLDAGGEGGSAHVQPGASAAYQEPPVSEEPAQQTVPAEVASSTEQKTAPGGTGLDPGSRGRRRRSHEERGPSTELGQATLERLSVSSRRALAEAARLAELANSSRIHMDQLLVGLYRKRDGPTQRLFRSVDPPLSESEFASLLEDVVEPVVVPDEVSDRNLPTPVLVSNHVRQAFEAAEQVADEYPLPDGLPRRIQTRHLLYGALGLASCTPIKALLARGVRQEAVALVERTPGEDGTERAGFRNDEATGRDLLDISREVEALAKVIAALEVDPPLAIGLFGPWGTGKTFFMRQLQRRIDEIAAAEAHRQEGSAVFHTRIVQLEFNAWHYIEQDLWASLASAIFDGLDEALARQRAVVDPPRQSPLDRARLETERAVALQDLARAEARKAQADALLASTEVRLQRLDSVFDDIAREVRPRDILEGAWGVAATQPELRTQVEAASERVNRAVEDTAKALGVDPADLRKQVGQQTSLMAWFRGAFRELVRGSRVWLPLAAAALFFMVVGIAAANLTAVSPAVAVLASTVAAAVGAASPALYAGVRVWNVIRSARSEGLRAIDGAREGRRRELVEEQAREARRSMEAAASVAEAQLRVEHAEAELAKEKPIRRLADFVSGRRASTDYRSRLGVIAQARDDFEQLAALLSQARDRSNGQQPSEAVTQTADIPSTATTEPGSPEGGFLPTIERIVLYIDDLDRCNEREVVAVLKAVNLLLAFPLFVVVVAVDPRWLFHSLHVELRAFGNGHVGDGDEETETEAEAEWEATPLNYLEKIFQIPFAIKPMGEDGFRALIEDLTRPRTETLEVGGLVDGLAGESDPEGDASSEEPGPRAGSTSAAGPATPADGDRMGTGLPNDPGTVEAQPSVLDASPIQISQAEQDFMATLHPLVLTPRAAKRFVNIYRLLKASAPASRRIAMEDPTEHQPVLLLLAMLTGHPWETTVVLRQLIDKEHSVEWWPFIWDVIDRSMAAEPTNAEARLKNERWGLLRDRLQGIATEMNAQAPLDPFVGWAPYVARFSFESSRVLIGQPVAPPSPSAA